jgi:hypothetical protein
MIHGRFMLLTVRLALVLVVLTAALGVAYTSWVMFSSTAAAQELVNGGHEHASTSGGGAVGCEEKGATGEGASTANPANPISSEQESPKPVLFPDGVLLP